MTDNTTLPGTGDIVEDIDGANGTATIKRQVVALGGIGKSGAHTALVAGQNTAANCIPVVQNSDPDQRSASGNITVVDSGSSAATGQDGQSVVTGAPTASSFQQWAINGRGAGRVQITGTFVGTLAFEGSIDGATTWFPQTARVAGTAYSRSSITSDGLLELDCSGLTHLRVRATAFASGTATAQATFSYNSSSASNVGVSGQRPFIFSGPINNAHSTYTTANLNIGGLITIPTGLPPGTILFISAFRLKAFHSGTNAGNVFLTVFNANPSGSTFTDNVTQVVASADASKAEFVTSLSFSGNVTANDIWPLQGINVRLSVDAIGNIYIALNSVSTTDNFTSTNALTYHLDGSY